MKSLNRSGKQQIKKSPSKLNQELVIENLMKEQQYTRKEASIISEATQRASVTSRQRSQKIVNQLTLSHIGKKDNGRVSIAIKKDVNGNVGMKLSTRRSSVKMLSSSMKKSSVRLMKKSTIRKSTVQTIPDESRLIKRFYRIKELIDTENTYVNNLKIMLEKYYLPCKEQHILEQKDLEKIFNPILKIFAVNKGFSYRLNEIYKDIKEYPQNQFQRTG